MHRRVGIYTHILIKTRHTATLADPSPVASMGINRGSWTVLNGRGVYLVALASAVHPVVWGLGGVDIK